MPSLQEKQLHLEAALRKMENVAVAFSGGVDSTLLLHIACKVLGAANVLALQGVSYLIAKSVSDNAAKNIEAFFPETLEHRRIEISPLAWQDFVANDELRCYYCKKRLYQLFQDEIAKGASRFLLDGTNVDDSLAVRPGSRAIRELGVQTPLLDAELTKEEIRFLAKIEGLAIYDLPADSCLATRLATGRPIDLAVLKNIERAEDFLKTLGFSGCRVRPFVGYVHIELRDCDFVNISIPENRSLVQRNFLEFGLGTAFISLIGR